MSKTGSEKDLVLDDDLLIQYLDFINGHKEKDVAISALLYYYRHDHLTNIAQLKRIGRQFPPQVMSQMAHRLEKNDEIEQLATRTKYKVILSEKKKLHHSPI